MKTKIAIIGEFQDGKSSLINALMGEDVAATGYGRRTTAEVTPYELPLGDCILLDTPGGNHDGGDDTTTLAGTMAADAFILLLARKEVSPELCQYTKRLISNEEGQMRPFLPLINDHGGCNFNISQESIAAFKMAGLHPLLFGNEMPVVHAQRWNKEIFAEDYANDERRLKYLLGMEPQAIPSPITRICAMMKALQHITKH